MSPSGNGAAAGYVAAGFEPVRDAFTDQLARQRNGGAACAAVVDGTLVADLWGGLRDDRTGDRWLRDTLVPVFSATKGLVALTASVARSRGWLDVDRPVAGYWPQFAANGKQAITVRQLLDHQAGVCVPDQAVTVADLADLDHAAALLAGTRPAWPPGQRHGYHLSTLGLYLNPVIRAADPAHRTLGRFFAEEIAGPLGAEFYIGLPDTIPGERLARVRLAGPRMLLHPRATPWQMLVRFANPRSLLFRSSFVPKGFDANDRASLRIEQPSGNGTGSARAIALCYGEFACGGGRLGITGEVLADMTAPPVTPPGGDIDAVLGIPSHYRLGWTRPGSHWRFSPSPRAFGTAGLGGSFGFADPDATLGYGWVTNAHGVHVFDDPRELAVRRALYRCLGATPP